MNVEKLRHEITRLVEAHTTSQEHTGKLEENIADKERKLEGLHQDLAYYEGTGPDLEQALFALQKEQQGFSAEQKIVRHIQSELQERLQLSIAAYDGMLTLFREMTIVVQEEEIRLYGGMVSRTKKQEEEVHIQRSFVQREIEQRKEVERQMKGKEKELFLLREQFNELQEERSDEQQRYREMVQKGCKDSEQSRTKAKWNEMCILVQNEEAEARSEIYFEVFTSFVMYGGLYSGEKISRLSVQASSPLWTVWVLEESRLVADRAKKKTKYDKPLVSVDPTKSVNLEFYGWRPYAGESTFSRGQFFYPGW